jgi:hypothetical protein
VYNTESLPLLDLLDPCLLVTVFVFVLFLKRTRIRIDIRYDVPGSRG